MVVVSIKDMPYQMRVALLKELGYNADDDGYVVDSSGMRIKDKYINQEIKVNNMVVFPGSILVLDDNPISISSYIDEYEAR